MYLWDIAGLRDALRAGPLPARAQFGYALGYAVLLLVCYDLTAAGATAGGYNRWDFAGLAASVAATVAGTRWLYLINGGEHGPDFLGRYTALGFVAGTRLLAPLVAVNVTIGLVQEYLHWGPGFLDVPDVAPSGWLLPLGMAASYALYYTYLVRQWRPLAGRAGGAAPGGVPGAVAAAA
jgi:hypothetical protein